MFSFLLTIEFPAQSPVYDITIQTFEYYSMNQVFEALARHGKQDGKFSSLSVRHTENGDEFQIMNSSFSSSNMDNALADFAFPYDRICND